MGQSTFTSDGAAPFVFDDNWDNFGNLRPQSRRLSATNAAPPSELLDAMPRKRRSLFRHAYGEAANTGLDTRNLFERALG